MELNQVDLNKLHAFAAVAEAGGVAAAARKLSVTPSAVSQSISHLEKSLGVALFERIGRKLRLTEFGERVLRTQRGYENELGGIFEQRKSQTAAVAGTIRVGIFLGFFRREFTLAASRFLLKFPHAVLRYVYAAPSEFEELLREGRLDVALSFNAPRSSKILRGSPLWTQELLLVGAPNFRSTRPTLADLERLPVVDYYSQPLLFARWTRHHFGKEGRPDSVRAYAASAPAVLELLSQGVGIGVVPKDLAQPYLKKGELIELGGPRPALRDRIWLLELKRKASQYRIEAFRAFLEDKAT